MSSNELWFTVLGPIGSGKTTLLACMNEYFAKLLKGSFKPNDDDTFKRLSEAYNALEEAANDSANYLFSGGIEGTGEEKQYTFNINNIPVRFFDFPGTWLNTQDIKEAEHYNSVEEKALRSSVIIAVINTPYIMQKNGRYDKYAGIQDIKYAIEKSLSPDGQDDKLILIVPVKCEEYLNNEAETRVLKGRIAKYFADIIKLAGEDSPYHGRLAVASLPVQTMGNVRFSYIQTREGDYEPVLVFRRIHSRPFMPVNIDQPLRYAISFLLSQHKKKRSGSIIGSMFDKLFGNNGVDKVLESIRSGIREDLPGFEIFAGRELLGLDDSK